MRKRKGNDKPPPRRFREFKRWPTKRVMEVAQMLYAVRPALPPNEKSEWKWNALAREANGFLDNLHAACERVAQYRRATDAAYRKSEKRSAQAISDVEPFTSALKIITHQERRDRAEKKFETHVLPLLPRYFKMTTRELRAQMKRWRRDAMPRDVVIELQIVYENAVRIAREKREQTRKRKPRYKGQTLTTSKGGIEAFGKAIRD
jgi:hypothetical protein